VVCGGLAVFAALGAFVWIAEHADSGLPLLSYRTVNVSVPNIGSLELHDEVRIAGVQVGQVIGTSTAAGRALVKLQLQGVGPLPADTRAAIRANGVLGSSYVQLIPGTSRPLLGNGATISAGPDSLAEGVPAALDLFDQQTRGALGNMIRGVGIGMLGRGTQLGQAIATAPAMLSDLDVVAHSIVRQPGAATRLLSDTDSALSALDRARHDIAGTFAPGAAALKPFVDQRAPVDRALARAPGTLRAVQSGLSTGVRLLGSVRSVADAASTTLSSAAPGLDAVDDLLTQAPGPLSRAGMLLRAVPPAVPDALRVLTSLRPNLVPLGQAFTNLLGPVTSLGQHGCDIRDFSEAWRSVFGYGSTPDGPLGPVSAFREDVVPTVQALGPVVKTPPYSDTQVYEPPCTFFPGPTYSLTGPARSNAR
jgi:ABC-type transporter Mla subunit MlaD